MSKKISVSVLFYVLALTILILPFSIFAANEGGGVTIKSIVDSITEKVWYVAAAIVVILWLTTGLLFLLAQGAPEKLNKAKVALLTSIAGTVIVILAYTALNLVADFIGA